MNFTQKLVRLCETRNRAATSKSVGLPATALSDYINKGNLPRLDKALAVAKALYVSLEWLADDKQEWPPVRVASTQIVEQYANQNIAA